METDGQYKSLYRTGAAESSGTIGTRPNLFWPIFESFLALFSRFFTNENGNQRTFLKESVRPNQILIASTAPLDEFRGYSLERQLKQPFGEMSTSIFNQFTFMSRSRTNEQFLWA